MRRVKKPKKKPPPDSFLSFDFSKLKGKIEVLAGLNKNGPKLKIAGETLYLSYPKKIWQNFSLEKRQILSENLAYSFTFFLPYLFPKIEKINYSMAMPISESFLFKGFSHSLPATALMQKSQEKKSTINLLRRLFFLKYHFLNRKTLIPTFRKNSDPKKVILPFSFGKDSLLTFGLCQELGLLTYPVYIGEPDYRYEYQIKKDLAKSFFKKTKIKIEFLKNNFGIFRESGGWFGWELQLTHYSLLLLPYVFFHNAGYLIFANEQSCNDEIIDSEGFVCNPVYEQSKSWLLSMSLMASLVGGNSLTIGSFIEPLYELAIIYILHHRYPDIAVFQTSCDPEDKFSEKLKGKRWCQNCSKCGRIYIFLLAHGINPKKVGFDKNLLAEKYQSLYSIFEDKKIKAYGYDQSEAGKEEQLFAFYLAYKKGVKGSLMTKFKKLYLREVSKKEKYFRQKFFGIHSSLTVPSLYKKQLLKIYHQELDPLNH